MAATAQEKVEKNVSEDYNRNSISIVVVDRGDNFDNAVYNAVKKSIKYGDKFDKNNISTDRVLVQQSREIKPIVANIDKAICNKTIGHEIIKYWFDSDNDGMMDGKLVEHRGRFNANDEAVLSANNAKIGESALKDAGYELINNSYVAAIDCCNILGDVKSGYVTMTISVYKVDFPTDTQNQFYESCWIDASTPKSEIAARKEAFSKISISLTPITSATATASAASDGSEGTSVNKAFAATIQKLENQIADWKVVTAIKSTHPIKAKIGTKEGLRNTQRYAAYETVVRNVGGEKRILSRKMGYVRATKVVDNNAYATGKSPMSEFYQISRVANVKPGQLLQQSNDLGLGIMAGYSIGGLSRYEVNLDYLAKMNTSGVSHYGLLDIGYDLMPGKDFDDDVIKLACGDLFDNGVSFINASVGYGLGLRLTRFVELVPSISAGVDYMMLNSEMIDLDTDESSSSSDSEDTKEWAYFGKLGVKANFTVAYPLQLVVGASYSLIVSEESTYSAYNDIFEACEDAECGNVKRRTGGLALTLGIKLTF